MSELVVTSTLDTILALQMTVARAGEGKCEPPRLGWWQTDLIDAGGADLFARLLPRTHARASLEGACEAGRRTDVPARHHMAEPARVRSFFFFGFEAPGRMAEGRVRAGAEADERAQPRGAR